MPLVPFPAGKIGPKGETHASFPDDFTPEDIQSTFASMFPEPEVVEEQPGIISNIGRGVAAGTVGIGESFLRAGQAATILTSSIPGLDFTEQLFEAGADKLAEVRESIGPVRTEPLPRLFDVFEEAGLASAVGEAFRPARILPQLGEFAPQLVSLLIPGALVTKGALALGAGPKLVTSARFLTVGTIGGVQEGSGSFTETLALGGSKELAARNLFATTAITGVLNALGAEAIIKGLPTGGLTRKITSLFLRGGAEAVTEFLEEPAQAILLKSEGFDIDFVDRLKAGLDVIPVAFIAGGGTSFALDLVNKVATGQELTTEEQATLENAQNTVDARVRSQYFERQRIPTLSDSEVEALQGFSGTGRGVEPTDTGLVSRVSNKVNELFAEGVENLNDIVDRLLKTHKEGGLLAKDKNRIRLVARDRVRSGQAVLTKDASILDVMKSVLLDTIATELNPIARQAAIEHNNFLISTEGQIFTELTTDEIERKITEGSFPISQENRNALAKAFDLPIEQGNLAAAILADVIRHNALQAGIDPNEFIKTRIAGFKRGKASPIVDPEVQKLPEEIANVPTNILVGSGEAAFSVQFSSDLDKAGFLVALDSPSIHHDRLLQFIKETTGLNEQEAILVGKAVQRNAQIVAESQDIRETNIKVDNVFIGVMADAQRAKDRIDFGPETTLLESGTRIANNSRDVDSLGFFSRLFETVKNLQTSKKGMLNVQQVVAILNKLNATETGQRGQGIGDVLQFLIDKKVANSIPQQTLMDYIAENSVTVSEIILGQTEFDPTTVGTVNADILKDFADIFGLSPIQVESGRVDLVDDLGGNAISESAIANRIITNFFRIPTSINLAEKLIPSTGEESSLELINMIKKGEIKNREDLELNRDDLTIIDSLAFSIGGFLSKIEGQVAPNPYTGDVITLPVGGTNKRIIALSANVPLKEGVTKPLEERTSIGQIHFAGDIERQVGSNETPIGWIRIQTVEIDGKSYLVLDEVQSDFGQEVERVGFATEPRLLNTQVKQNFPFSTNWSKILLKRFLYIAAEEGHDGVLLTTGDEQQRRGAEEGIEQRYDVSNPKLLSKELITHGGKAVKKFDSGVLPLFEEFDLQGRISREIDTTVHSALLTPEIRSDVLENGASLFMKGKPKTGISARGQIIGLDAAGNATPIFTASRFLFRGLTAPDLSTALHEVGHFAALTSSGQFAKSIESTFANGKKIAKWSRNDHEKFAEAFQVYFMTGTPPSPKSANVFGAIKDVMEDIYTTSREILEGSLTLPQKHSLDMLFINSPAVPSVKGVQEIQEITESIATMYEGGRKLKPLRRIDKESFKAAGFEPRTIKVIQKIMNRLPENEPITHADLLAVAEAEAASEEVTNKIVNRALRGTPLNNYDVAGILMVRNNAIKLMDDLIKHVEDPAAIAAYSEWLQTIEQAISNARSQAGRSLNAWKIGPMISEIMKSIKVLNENILPSQSLLFNRTDFTDLKQVSELLEAFKPHSKIRRVIKSLFFESMLWNPGTIGINSLSNLGNAIYTSGTRAHMALWDKFFSKITGRSRRTIMGEAFTHLGGTMRSITTDTASIFTGNYTKAQKIAMEGFFGIRQEDGTLAFATKDDSKWDEILGLMTNRGFEDFFHDFKTSDGRFLFRSGKFRIGPNGETRNIGELMALGLNGGTRTLRGMDMWQKATIWQNEERAIRKRLDFLQKNNGQQAVNDEIDRLIKEESRRLSRENILESIKEKEVKISLEEGLVDDKGLPKIRPLNMDEKLTSLILHRTRRLAEDVTFQSAPGDLTKVFMRGREKTGVMGLVMIPFIQTPANIIKRGIEFIPGFGAYTAHKWSGLPPLEIWAKQVEGMALVFVIMGLMESGAMTGPPPDEPAERDAFFRAGKLPFAFRQGDNYVQYRRMEPFAIPVGMIAGLYEEMKRIKKNNDNPARKPKDNFDTFVAMVRVASDLMVDSTFMQGFLGYLGTDRDLTRSAARTFSSFVPYSSLIRFSKNEFEAFRTDQVKIRENDTFFSMFGQSLPKDLFRESASDPRVNIFGEEMVRDTNWLKEWLPIRIQPERSNTLENEFISLDRYPSLPGRLLSIQRRKPSVRIPDDLYREYVVKSGKRLKIDLDNMIQRPFYIGMSKDNKIRTMKRIVERIRRQESRKIKMKMRNLGL